MASPLFFSMPHTRPHSTSLSSLVLLLLDEVLYELLEVFRRFVLSLRPSLRQGQRIHGSCATSSASLRLRTDNGSCPTWLLFLHWLDWNFHFGFHLPSTLHAP
eukprot:2560881-Heterocapsa_arctica.AAC.1